VTQPGVCGERRVNAGAAFRARHPFPLRQSGATCGWAHSLVVGARGLGGVAKMLLGSVSEYCVRHASCPVLDTRAHEKANIRGQSIVRGLAGLLDKKRGALVSIVTFTASKLASPGQYGNRNH
jgi:hypothetical protein